MHSSSLEPVVSPGLEPSSGRKPPPLPALWIIVVVQAVVHAILLPFGPWITDTALLQTWAVSMANHPLATFYASQKRADHLPGDLWILRLETWVYQLISGNSPGNFGFLKALKIGPGLADLVIAVMLFLIAREIGGERVGRRAALLFALNPAPYFISMVWGVADSVSMAFAMLAILLTLRGRFWAAIPVLAYACLIKPQLGIFAPLLLIFVLHEAASRPGPRRFAGVAIEIVVGGAGALVVLLAALLPFDVGLPFMHQQWGLIERMQFSANLYTNTTMNALNVWALAAGANLHFPSGKAPADSEIGRFGLSYQHWSIVLTGVVCVILALPLICKGGAARLVWTCASVTFAFFMLQTRIHERYFFPAVTLMAIVVALRPRWFSIYVAMCGAYFMNVWWVYPWLKNLQFNRNGPSSNPRDIGSHVPHYRPGPSGAATERSLMEVRFIIALNLLALGVFVIHALLDLREPAENDRKAFQPATDSSPAPSADFQSLTEHS